MDGERFANLARVLARATTRRRLLGGVTAGSGALLLSRFGRGQPQAAAQSTTAGLAEAVNAYRQSQGLPAIPVSAALTQVAQTHVQDLATYHPEAACNRNLHSWSTNGTWSGGCYDPNNQATWPLMWNKPKEIASYPGRGYEVAAWATPAITAQQAVDVWRQDPPHDDVLLNHGIWATLTWQSLGGWVANGYACAWFGEEPSATPPPPTAAPQSATCPFGPNQCLPGYVWRDAYDGDAVCVTPDRRTQAHDDNAHAAERVDPNGAYGPTSCQQGYVWRAAFPDDAVCVSPDERTKAADDNSRAAERKDPACAGASGATLVGPGGTPEAGVPVTPAASAATTGPLATVETGPPPAATAASDTTPSTAPPETPEETPEGA